MKTITTLLLLSLLTYSCKGKDGDGDSVPDVQVDPTPTELLVAQLQGNYHVCMASMEYGGYFSEITISIVGNVYTKTETLSLAADCSAPYYEFVTTAEIFEAATISTTPTHDITLDLKIKSYSFKDLDGWYSTQNYCGLNTWVINVAKDVTGLDCPNLNGSAFGTQYRAVDDFAYESMTIGTNSIDVVIQENESGLDLATRRVTGIANIPKL
jgi:hypothetical protein